MGRGGCHALYLMVENRGYEWYNQNKKDVDKSGFSNENKRYNPERILVDI